MKVIATVLACVLLSSACSQLAPARDASLQAVADLERVLEFIPAREVPQLPGDLVAAELPTGIDMEDRWAAIRYGRDRVIVWGIKAKKQLFSHVFDRPISRVSLSSRARTVAIQQREDLAAAAYRDGSVSHDPGDVSLWDTRSGKQIGRVSGAFTRIAFNREGDRLVAGDGSTMVIYHIQEKRSEVLPVQSIAPLNKIEEYSEVYPVGFIGDDQTVIAAGDETLLRWQGTGSRPELVSLDYTTHKFDLSGDGESLVLASNGYVSIWDTTRMMQVKTWRLAGHSRGYIDDIGFDAMGTHVIALATGLGIDAAAGELMIEVYETSATRRVWSTRTRFYSNSAYPFDSSPFAPTDLLDSARGLITVRTPVEITLVRQEGNTFAVENGPEPATCDRRLITDAIKGYGPHPQASNPVCRNGYAYVQTTNMRLNPTGKTDALLRWSYGKWRVLAWGSSARGGRLSPSEAGSAGVPGRYVAQLLPEADIVVDD